MIIPSSIGFPFPFQQTPCSESNDLRRPMTCSFLRRTLLLWGVPLLATFNEFLNVGVGEHHSNVLGTSPDVDEAQFTIFEREGLHLLDRHSQPCRDFLGGAEAIGN